MRINGFEQIKCFYSWVFNNPDKARPVHVSLYIFLVNQNNRNNWVEWFKCPFDLAMQGACIGSKSTYYSSLKDLQSWGLIEYKEGVNNSKAPLIKLIVLSKSEPQTIPQSEPLTEQLTEPLTGLLSGNIYKLITDNLKLVTENLSDWIEKEKEKSNIDTKIRKEQFAKFWAYYKKGSKKDAMAGFLKLTDKDIELMRIHLPVYFKSTPERQFRKDAERYISKRLWENDDIAELKQTATLPKDWWNMELTPEQWELLTPKQRQEKKNNDLRKMFQI